MDSKFLIFLDRNRNFLNLDQWVELGSRHDNPWFSCWAIGSTIRALNPSSEDLLRLALKHDHVQIWNDLVIHRVVGEKDVATIEILQKSLGNIASKEYGKIYTQFIPKND